MPSDQQVEEDIRELVEYQRQDRGADLLQKYGKLLQEYKRLKSDLEEEQESREKYKQLARGQERNPFVLVLVDGDGYVFADDTTANGAEGGSTSAKRLHSAINASLRKKGLEHCKVLVRVYANLAGLSKALSKAALCGAEKRSLAPFVAGFNRSHGFTDFVDAGELKESADFKLREMLRFYAESAQCKHIYFAACHDVGYVSELMPHRDSRDRITLIRTPSLGRSPSGVHREFEKLGFPIEELTGVFRAEPLIVPVGAVAPTVPASAPPSTPNGHGVPKSNGGPDKLKICPFYTSGFCKFGKNCRNKHPGDTTFNARRNLSKSDEEFIRHNTYDSGMRDAGGSWRDRDQVESSQSLTGPIFSKLPTKEQIPEGHVAINNSDYRLDPYIIPPTFDSKTRLQARIASKRLCNAHQLTGTCTNPSCAYDHSPLEEDLKSALESLARLNPCHKKGNCRDPSCTQGHICQIPDCSKHRGTGKGYCKIPYFIHQVDLNFEKVIPGIPKPSGKYSVSTAETEMQNLSSDSSDSAENRTGDCAETSAEEGAKDLKGTEANEGLDSSVMTLSAGSVTPTSRSNANPDTSWW